MKQQLFLYTVLAGLILSQGCDKIELKNRWRNSPVVIDGSEGDWEDSALHYLEDLDMMMGSANDADYLYLIFQLSDNALARKINRFGATVWVDDAGGKNKDYGVQYAGSVLFMPDRARSENPPRELRDRMAKILHSRPEPGTITVINGDERRSMPQNNNSGPAANSGNEQGLFCYEFRIPLPLDTDFSRKLSLGIEIGGIDQKELGRTGGLRAGGGRPGMGGSMGRAGGRARSGGAGRAPAESRRPDRSAIEKQELWLKVLLTENAQTGL